MKLPWKHEKKQPLTPWEEAVQLACKKWKQYERRKKYWKIYMYVLFVLPVFASILTVKVVKTYVRIKLRQIAVNVASEGLTKEASKPQSPAPSVPATEPETDSCPDRCDGCADTHDERPDEPSKQQPEPVTP